MLIYYSSVSAAQFDCGPVLHLSKEKVLSSDQTRRAIFLFWIGSCFILFFGTAIALMNSQIAFRHLGSPYTDEQLRQYHQASDRAVVFLVLFVVVVVGGLLVGAIYNEIVWRRLMKSEPYDDDFSSEDC